MTAINSGALEQLCRELLAAAAPAEVRELLARHPWLLTAATAPRITALVRHKTQPADLWLKIGLLAGREFLQRCRETGVDRAIAAQSGWPLADHNPLQHLLMLPDTARPETRRQAARWALALVRPETEAEVWGLVQYNLGLAAQAEVNAGQPAAMEPAIDHFSSALTAWQTTALSPRFTGRALSNLGRLYLLRQDQNRGADLETALTYLRQALEVLPAEIAAGQPESARLVALTLLGDGYLQRLAGERRDNIELAIEHFAAALALAEANNQPAEAANLKHNLAVAYRLRLADKPARNYETALSYARQAYQYFKQQAMPAEWARASLELATILAHRQGGNRQGDLEQAIKFATDALAVYQPGAHLPQWLLAKMTLGNLYCEPVAGHQVYDGKRAIACFKEVIAQCDPTSMPIRWAEAQNNLGAVYAEQSRRPGDKAYRQAVACFEQASEIRTPETLPDQARRTALNWGNLTFRQRQWIEALRHYETALVAGEVLYQSSITPAGRRAELAENAGLAVNAAYSLAREHQFDRSLLVLDHSKTRLLAEALALSEAKLAVLPVEQQSKYQQAVERVRRREAEYHRLAEGGKAGLRSEREIIADLTEARAELKALIDVIRQDHPDFLPAGLDLAQLVSLIPAKGALIAPAVTGQGSIVFVVPAGVNTVTTDHILWLDGFTRANLHTLLIGTEADPGWLRVYLNRRSTPKVWDEVINSSIEQLNRQLVSPIVEKLAQLGVERGSPLLLLPQGGLGLLPLHAPLLDDYCVTYAPSGYALHAARQRLQARGDLTPSQPPPGRGRSTLLAVVNPTGDLPFAPAEGDVITPMVDPAQVTRLDGSAATLETVGHHLQPATCQLLHFSGHGFYDWDEVMQSGLVLADGELTLSRFISQANLGTVRLVTLSACETGITDISQSPDEFLGLPAGLMQAGAPAVVSTLWAVNDLSTMLLMERFYQHYLQDKLPLPEALRRAQLWLRDVTAGELLTYFEAEQDRVLSGKAKMCAEIINDQFVRFATLPTNNKPFSHPYYWAAFTFSGV